MSLAFIRTGRAWCPGSGQRANANSVSRTGKFFIAACPECEAKIFLDLKPGGLFIENHQCIPMAWRAVCDGCGFVSQKDRSNNIDIPTGWSRAFNKCFCSQCTWERQ